MFSQARSYALILLSALTFPVTADLESQLASGDFRGAEESLEELASKWENAAASQEDEIEWARVLMALGTIERKLLKSEEAELHLRKALELFGSEVPEEALETREALALALQDQGKLEEAEPLLRLNLEAGGPRTAAHLGLVMLQQGRYAESGELLARAFEETEASDSVGRARRHHDLGRYWHTLGSHARALEHFDQGLALLDNTPNHLELILSLTSQRALAQLRLHELDAAREGFERAASIAREIHQNQPLAALPHLENLGILALASQNPSSARERFSEALGLLADADLSDHPAAITARNNMGIALLRSGKFEEAKVTLLEARLLQMKHLPEIHLRVAETERNLAIASMQVGDDATRDRVRSANRIGLKVLDQILRHGTETERLNFLERIDLVSLSCTLGDPEVIADLLLASKSRLLDQLIRPTDPVDAPSWQEAQKALDPDTIFLDFCRYQPPGELPRYGAILLKSTGTPEWFPLGSEAQLGAWLDALHARLGWKADELAGEPSKPVPFLMEGILRELHTEVLGPIQDSIPKNTSRWLISPDGLIHGVPFVALRDPQDRFLGQSIDMLARLGSGRDLLKSDPVTPLDDKPWLLAGVSRFPSENLDPASHLATILDHPSSLPGTKKELRKIAAIAPEGSLQQIDISEADLLALDRSHRVIHLSTHSFFLDHEDMSETPIDLDRSADRLFASGILLHRAGLRRPDTPLPAPDDDILFPSEIAKLPLQDTRLVTLSSCHSGVGTSIRGEGQIGLQRALSLAGTREVVSSLWPVSDQGSPEFMERFYQLVIATGNPAQALWQTQRERLTDPDDLDEAVLLNAPFLLTQHGPALALEEIPPAPKRLPWIWFVSLPLAIFVVARLMKPRKPQARAHTA